MTAKYTPEQRKLVFEWVERHPDAMLDFIRCPEDFYADYNEASDIVRLALGDRSLGSADPVRSQAAAYDELIELGNKLFPYQVPA